MTEIAQSFLKKLKKEIMHGQTQAEIIRNYVKKDIANSISTQEAIVRSMNRTNREMLYPDKTFLN